MVWTSPRKSWGPLGGHEQSGTGTAAVDWVWGIQERESEPDLRVRLVPLGWHSDSRASGLAIGTWCLLVCTVTVGQADLREASGDQLLDVENICALEGLQ